MQPQHHRPPSRLHGFSNKLAGLLMFDRGLKHRGESEMGAARYEHEHERRRRRRWWPFGGRRDHHYPSEAYADSHGNATYRVRPRGDGRPTFIHADGATIEVRARGGRHSTRTPRDNAYYDRRFAKYRAIQPDFSNHYRRHWGHPEHRCLPHYHGLGCLIRGFLTNNEALKTKGRIEREFARRERRQERRRRWALFKAEARANYRGYKTPLTV